MAGAAAIATDTGKPVARSCARSWTNPWSRGTLLITPEQVAEGINFYREMLGLKELCIFPGMPGDSYDKTAEQIT